VPCPRALFADFRGWENNQAFRRLAPRFSWDFVIPVPHSLIVFPARSDPVSILSRLSEP
jgi:hypothetical protein